MADITTPIQVHFYVGGESAPLLSTERHLRPREGERIRIKGRVYTVREVTFDAAGTEAEVRLRALA